ncbi:MAG: biotin--[acetyl-CoA-carboxylase] ligase [candidate division WOR-3 bacterium]|nr:biotin--[acetyl-CoA-carboxylase] ligase [candidate division WOR-3 bacterium]
MATEVAGEQLAGLARYGSVHLLDEVGSTNDYALGLAAKRSTAIVTARRQTKGRGRFKKHWFSDDGSLTASLLLFTDGPDFPHPSFLTHLAGLALSRAVEEVAGLATQIRWPNDIIYKDKKLAGILCEGRRHAVAVGVGLNVNQESFPEDLPDAESLRVATGRTWDKLVLLESFLHGMFAGIERAGKGETAQVIADIKNHSAVMHRRVEVRTLLRKHVGTVIDLDTEGRVVLRTDSGRLVVLGAGEVRRLR